MFAEFLVTYVPLAIAAVILVPIVIVHLAMFIDGMRSKRWSQPASRAPRASTYAPVARRAAPHTQPAPTWNGGLGLRHGVAAPRDHD